MDLDDRLEDVFRQHRDDLEEAWLALEGGDELLEFLKEVSSDLTAAVPSLTTTASEPSQQADWHELLSLMRNAETEPAISQYVEVRLAESLLLSTREIAVRSKAIAGLIVNGAVAPQTRKYLKLLSRCYLSQYDHECVILRRSVLEASMKEVFDRNMDKLPGARASATMSEKIRLARELGWLSRGSAKVANDVWFRGNKAVHEDPELVRDVFGTLASTLTVVTELARAR